MEARQRRPMLTLRRWRSVRKGERRAGVPQGVCAFAFGRVGEGFNFVRDYYFGFNSSFYGSLGIIMSMGVVGTPLAGRIVGQIP